MEKILIAVVFVTLMIGCRTLPMGTTKGFIHVSPSIKDGVIRINDGDSDRIFTGSRRELLALYEKLYLKQLDDTLIVKLIKIRKEFRRTKNFNEKEPITYFRKQTIGEYKGGWLEVAQNSELIIGVKPPDRF